MGKQIPIDQIVDFAGGRLSREEALALLDRIEHDERASEELDLVASMMDVVVKEGDALSAERTAARKPLLARMRSFGSSLLPEMQSHPILSGTAAFALALAALMILLPPSSPYGSLASLDDFDFAATVRGVGTGEFEVAFDQYREGKYEESARLFDRYTRAFPHSTLLEYAHYSAGAAYLRWSEWRLASLYVGFNRERVVKGMDHLQEVIRISSDHGLLEDTHWLLAKGNLMLLQTEQAVQELRVVVQMGGGRSAHAAGLIQAVQRVQQSR
jgi:hypothetical protein